MTVDQTTARRLGYFSLALGLAQLIAPRRFAESIGVRNGGTSETLVRAVGARELLTAAGLLAARNPAPWVWLRVGGDVMDLAILSRTAGSSGVDAGRVNGALAGTVAVTAVDVATGFGATNGHNGRTNGNGTTSPLAGVTDRARGAFQGGKPVRASVTIDAPRADLFGYWRRLDHLPEFMRHLKEVRELDDRRSHWVATAPLGSSVQWDAEITSEIPETEISWRALPDSTVRHEGTVRFITAPGDRGTEVHVELTYQPPAGPIGVAIAKLFGEEPEQQISEDLRRLKQVFETGSVVWSDATRGERRLRQPPAQPSATAEPTTRSSSTRSRRVGQAAAVTAKGQ